MEQQRREDVQRVQQSIRTALRLANEDGVREPNEDLEDLDWMGRFTMGQSWIAQRGEDFLVKKMLRVGNRSWKYDELWFCDGF